jgi:type VI secretion system protein ImpA
MPVGELMGELMPDTNSRNIFRQLTGVEFDGGDMGAPVVAPSATAAAQADNSYAAPQPTSAPTDEW